MGDACVHVCPCMAEGRLMVSHSDACGQCDRYGTQKTRLGKEAQIPFGHCALSLAPAIDPVASFVRQSLGWSRRHCCPSSRGVVARHRPAGDIYCRECIYKYLLDQKQKIKRAKAQYEAQVAELEAEDAAGRAEAEEKRIQVGGVGGGGGGGYCFSSLSPHARWACAHHGG